MIATLGKVLILASVSPAIYGDSTMQIEKTYDLNFPIETVYTAWVSSDTVIPPATSMDVLPEVGGHYRLIIEMPDFSGKNEGKFLKVEPGKRVVYTWEWNGDGEVTTIDVSFLAVDAGTRIQLTHTGFEKEESVTNHDSGWDSYISGFIEHLSSGTK